MDYSPPTAADYAWSAAHDAKQAIEVLQKRIAALEIAVFNLTKALAESKGSDK